MTADGLVAEHAAAAPSPKSAAASRWSRGARRCEGDSTATTRTGPTRGEGPRHPQRRDEPAAGVADLQRGGIDPQAEPMVDRRAIPRGVAALRRDQQRHDRFALVPLRPGTRPRRRQPH